jgi:Putative transposase
VGRYTHRVAISTNRLLKIDNGQVVFRWKDSRDRGQPKTMTLAADEFSRRFLLQVLPAGFQRIRYDGFLGNRYRAPKLARCRPLLGRPVPEATAADRPKDYRDRSEALTGVSLRAGPVCQQGCRLVVEVFGRVHGQPTTADTSGRCTLTGTARADRPGTAQLAAPCVCRCVRPFLPHRAGHSLDRIGEGSPRPSRSFPAVDPIRSVSPSVLGVLTAVPCVSTPIAGP